MWNSVFWCYFNKLFFLFLSLFAQDAELEERIGNLLVAAYENLQENDDPVEERIGYNHRSCFLMCGVYPNCHPC